MEHYQLHHHHNPNCLNRNQKRLTYMITNFPDEESSIRINHQNYHYDNNETNTYDICGTNESNYISSHPDMDINIQSQENNYPTDVSLNYNNTLSHITSTDPNIQAINPNINRYNDRDFNSRNLLNKNNLKYSTPSINYSKSESISLPTNPFIHMNLKKNGIIKPKASLNKIANSNPIKSITSLSYLTNKKITELKMKQLSDSLHKNNDSMMIQKNATLGTVPLKNNSILYHNQKIVPHLNPRMNEVNESKRILPNNLNNKEINEYKGNISNELLNDRLHQFILEENAYLKNLNNQYKQMLDSCFYFINSLSYGQNNQKEYDVIYFTDHLSELNNALLDLEKVLKLSLDQGHQFLFEKEQEMKEREKEIRAQLIETLTKEKKELFISSLNQVLEIEFSFITPIKEPINTEMIQYPSFGNEIMTDELISNQKEVNNECNKNCIACMVGANNSTRGYSSMNYNPYHYKTKDLKNNSNSKSKGKNTKSRSITPTNRKLNFSNQKYSENNSLNLS